MLSGLVRKSSKDNGKLEVAVDLSKPIVKQEMHASGV